MGKSQPNFINFTCKIMHLIVIIYCFNRISKGTFVQANESNYAGPLDLSCLDENADCLPFERSDVEAHCINGNCECTNNITNANVFCEPNARLQTNIIGGACPCSMANSDCNAMDNICRCTEGYMASKDRRRCLPVYAALGETCEMDKQCYHSMPFSQCNASAQQCKCSALYEQYNNRCLSVLNKICQGKSGCEQIRNSKCAGERFKCACNAKYVANANRTACLHLARLGEQCTLNEQCQLGTNYYATCQDGICACNAESANYINKSNRTSCKPLVAFGAYCRNDHECRNQHIEQTQDGNMLCVLGECRCADDYKLLDNNQCTQAGAEISVEVLPLQSIFALALFAQWAIFKLF